MFLHDKGYYSSKDTMNLSHTTSKGFTRSLLDLNSFIIDDMMANNS